MAMLAWQTLGHFHWHWPQLQVLGQENIHQLSLRQNQQPRKGEWNYYHFSKQKDLPVQCSPMNSQVSMEVYQDFQLKLNDM